MKKSKAIILQPLPEPNRQIEEIEKEIVKVFKALIYYPLLRTIKEPKKTLQKNSIDKNSAIVEALNSGRITFNRGQFSGRFNAAISKELKALGAQWDRKQRTWKISLSSLPMDLRSAISATSFKFQQKIDKINKILESIVPEELAGKIDFDNLIDKTIYKMEGDFEKSIRGITIAPKITPQQKDAIAKDWTNNLRLYIRDFTKKEIVRLREDVQKSVFAGNRYESMIKTIQKSYGVSQNKAKFLARQETNLLITTYKQIRYEDAGSKEYIWTCVKMPHQHKGQPYHKGDVRYHHAELDGTVQRWDMPPVVNEKGERKHPGQDFNCRCVARPVIGRLDK